MATGRKQQKSVLKPVDTDSFPELIKSHFCNLYKHLNFTDITIISSSSTFEAHRVVLSLRSMDWGGSSLAKTRILNLEHVPDTIIRLILKWCYLNHNITRDLGDKDMVQMLAVASNLGLKTLEQNCVKQINEKRTNYPVAAEILDASDRESRSVSTILNTKPHHRLKDHNYCFQLFSLLAPSSDRNNNSSSSQNLSRRLCLPDTVDQGVQVGTLEFLSKDSSTITYMIPSSDVQKVFINWSIPDPDRGGNSCGNYISQLVSHSGHGSLVSVLRSRGWIDKLIAGQKVSRLGSYFVVNMDLTQEGLQQIDNICMLMFQFLGKLKQHGTHKWIFKVCSDVNELKFQLKGDTPSTGAYLQLYPGEDALAETSSSVAEWKPELITEVLDHLTPARMRVMVVAQHFADKCGDTDVETEPWYGAKYQCEKLSEDKIKTWTWALENSGPHPELKMPDKRTFTVTNIKTVEEKKMIMKCDQVTQTNKIPSQVYSDEYYEKCTLLMYKSLGCYKLLRNSNLGRFPHPRSIRKRVQHFRCEPGLNDEMFFLFAMKIQSVEPKFRNIAMAFDEVHLHNKHQYSMHFQKLIKGAKKCLVVMARGLGQPFKDILYYDFDNTMNIGLFHAIVNRIEAVGGKVRTLTMDLGNPTLMSETQFARGTYSLPHPSKKRKIFIFPDVPHQVIFKGVNEISR